MSYPSSSHRSASSFSAARRVVSGLSDSGLLNATARLAKTERLTTLEILVHLDEVEKRELYLTVGCGSMFDYCVNQLGYSRSAAWRRIHSARCLGRFPEVCTSVEKNELSLTTLFLIAGTLTMDNEIALLNQVRGKTENEVQKILAAYKPPATYRDRVKLVRVVVPTPKNLAPSEHPQSSAPADLELNAALRTAGRSHTAERSGPGDASGNDGPAKESAAISAGAAGGPTTRRYALETQLLIQFVASEAFMGKYHEARSLLSNKLTEISFATVFETTLDAFLDKHSPGRKQARRETRAAMKKRSTQKDQTRRTPEPQTQRRKPAARADQLSRKKFDGRCRSGTDIMLTGTSDEQAKGHARGQKCKTSPPAQKKTPGKSRHISAKTRDAVFVRDKSRCTHVGSNGKRCESTNKLQIDHIVPYARGGTNALSNLRLLCAKHNKLEAKRVFGAAKIDEHCRRE